MPREAERVTQAPSRCRCRARVRTACRWLRDAAPTSRIAAATVALLGVLGGGAGTVLGQFHGDGPAVYTVLLDSPSVGEQLIQEPRSDRPVPARRARATVAQMRRAVTRDQESLVRHLESLGIDVVGSARNVLNAIFVRASPEQIEKIGAIPGIAGVTPGRRYQPMLKSVAEIVHLSTARIGASDLPLFGDNLKIAIIDSGLDFDHEGFRDPSLPVLPGYPKADSEYLDLASPKVVAVRSYVGYLNSGAVQTSSPDNYSPWDLGGHGTAVAMIAAGNRVESPLGPISGIAPKARIGVYKVFGTPGLNFYTADHVVIMAIDDAVEDGMDILNLSLGNPTYYGADATGSDCGLRSSQDPCDPLAAAARSAVEDFDRVVVVAAGNFGLNGSHTVPALTTINSPGDVDSVITVGQTGNAARLTETVQIGEDSFEARSGTGPDADGVLTAEAVLASGVGDPQGCEAFPENAFLGRIAVIERSECFFLVKVEHADAAGAVGVLIVNHEGDELVEMALLERTDIPAFFVGKSSGAAIQEALADRGGQLTFDPTPIVTEHPWQYVMPTSSHGPALSFQPKPDLVAPGDDVYTAVPRYNDQGVLYSPGGFRALSGTSFAAPAVAGAAALVWEVFPNLSARQVASALINSAAPLLMQDETLAPLNASGAGVLDIEAALLPTVTAVPSSIGFGSLRNSPFPIRRQLALTNKSSRPQNLLLRVVPQYADSAAQVTVDGRGAVSFRLEAHATRRIEVALSGGHPVPGSYEGRLRVTSLSGHGDVHVPFLYIVGDNEPANALRFQGRSATGIEGEATTKTLTARVVDQYGAPVVGRPVSFQAIEGSPSILRASPTSLPTGLVFARVRYSGEPDPQVVSALIGDLEIAFGFEASGSKPAVLSITNSANPNSTRGLVPGSLATISGGPFSLFPSGPASVPQERPLPIRRKGISVAFDAPQEGISVAGRIYSVSEESVVVQVPWELASVDRVFASVRRDNRSEPFEVDVTAVDPGIFTYVLDGRSYAVAFHADGTQVDAQAPARPGKTVTLSMTGNGSVDRPPITGNVVAKHVPTEIRPEVSIGIFPAEVASSGLSPDLAGLYQVTVRIPETLVPGDYAIQVTMGEALSNRALLPVR